MTTTFLFAHRPQNGSGFSTIGAFLLEPVFILASCLFWLIVLPLGAVFWALAAVYDRLVAPHPRPIHSATVLRRSRVNPFTLGQTNLHLGEDKDSSAQLGRHAQA